MRLRLRARNLSKNDAACAISLFLRRANEISFPSTTSLSSVADAWQCGLEATWRSIAECIAFPDKIQQQLSHRLRLLLLHPVPRTLDQVTTQHLRAGARLH